ncbi:MAG TPA: AAA family ATPase, partial [Coriobacteriia bacterium]|nr:AAA family ATPase [Coriobacteriia bacterium]
MKTIPRAITPRLLAALGDTPAVMLVGPRQAGKSTLVQGLAGGPHPARYLTLDDLRTLDAAHSDPVGFVENADCPLVIDEIQRAPELLLDGTTRPAPAPASVRGDLIDRIVRGGFPEAIAREADRREEWLASYLTVIVQRDLRDLANIERLAEVPAVLASLASRVRAPLNKTDVSSS